MSRSGRATLSALLAAASLTMLLPSCGAKRTGDSPAEQLPEKERFGGAGDEVPLATRYRLLDVLGHADVAAPRQSIETLAKLLVDHYTVAATRVSPLIKNVALGDHKIEWEARKALLAAVPSAFTFRLTPPPKAVLEFGAGRIMGVTPDGAVKLIVEVQEGSQWKVLTEKSANGKSWKDVSVSLAAYAGKKIALRLRSDGPKGAPAVFGNPIIRSHDPESIAATAEKPNVLMIVVDTLAATRVGCYGYAGGTTPNIDKLCARGTKFANAFTTANWTRPAVTSLVTAKLPMSTGIPVDRFSTSPSEKEYYYSHNRYPLPRVFRDAGFAVKAYVNNLFLMQQFLNKGPTGDTGIDAGFEEIFNDDRYKGPDAPNLTQRTIDWMTTHKDERFFSFVQLANPHAPYYEYPVFTKKYTQCEGCNKFQSGRYNGAVAYSDHHVGMILDALDKLKIADKTIVVLLADHGEVLDDRHNFWGYRFTEGWRTEGRNLYDHGHSVYDEVGRIPLIVAGPGIAARQIDAQIQISDIMPTVTELAGLKVRTDQGYDGLSYAAAVRQTGAAPDKPALMEGSGTRAIRTPAWKYIIREEDVRFVRKPGPDNTEVRVNLGEELFDLAKDPDEVTNLASQNRAAVVEMQRLLANAFYDKRRGYHLRLFGDGQGGVLEGTLTVAGGDFRDFVLVRPAGQDTAQRSPDRKRITFKVSASGQGSGITFRTAPETPAGLTVDLKLNGTPLPLDVTHLGQLRLPFAKMPLELKGEADARKVRSEAMPMVEAADKTGVYFWLIPDLSPTEVLVAPEVKSIMQDWGYLRPAATTK